MNKKIVSVVLVTVVIILGVWSLKNKTTDEKEIIKIGVVAPITGGSAAYGSTLVKGVEMALADLDKNTKYKYELVIEDDETNSAKSSTVAQKMISIDKVKAIITVGSLSGNAVKPFAEKNGVVHICDCTDITIGNVSYNFTNLVLPHDEIKIWLDEAAKRGYKRIAILGLNHPGMFPLINSLDTLIPEYDISVVHKEIFQADTRDFKTIIAKAKSKNPDIYLILSLPPALDILSKQLIESGVKNISTTALFTTSPTPELYNGLWFTDSTLTDRDFMSRFTKLYPEIRFNARTVPYGYDIVNMLVQGFEKGGDLFTNIKSITEYNGKVGKITKEPNSQNFRSSASIWVMKNGVPEMMR